MRQEKFVVLGLLALLCSACTGAVDSSAGNGDDTGEGGSGGGGDGGSSNPPDQPPTGLVKLEEVCTEKPTVSQSRWRRITASQYRNAVRDLLSGIEANTSSFLLDTKSGPFDSNSVLAPQAEDIANYGATAEAVSTQATSAANLSRTLGCDVAKTGEDGCASTFIDSFVSKAFRRPLTSAQKTAFNALYKTGKEESFAAGIRLVIQGALQSPNFLYMPEFGRDPQDGVTQLTGHEVATRLSFLLWGTTPDNELMEAAAKGQLDSKEGIKAQAQRLLNNARARAATTSFFTQLLDLGRLEQASAVIKDPTRYPTFNDAMKSAMAAESKKFFDYVFDKDDGSIQTILTAPYSFPSGPLMDVYGIAGKTAPSDGKFMFDGVRSGILTSAAVLAVHPHGSTLFPAVARGKLIRNNFLCTDLPPPPMASNFQAPPNAAMLSEQELNRRHRDDPSCNSCHALLEPLGFGLDAFDSLGRIRKTANDGTPIDGSGDIKDSDVEGPYKGPMELTSKLAQSKNVRACLARQWVHFSLGREPGDADECSVQRTAHILAEGKGDVRAAVMELVTTDAFRFRKGQ